MGNKLKYYSFTLSNGTTEVMSLTAATYSKDPKVIEQVNKIKKKLKGK